jgi:hypothetical protein
VFATVGSVASAVPGSSVCGAEKASAFELSGGDSLTIHRRGAWQVDGGPLTKKPHAISCGAVVAPQAGLFQSFESCFVIDLAAARKRMRPDTLERPKGPRTIEMLDRAEAFQSLLDRGVVNNRAELARMHGISRARVTQLMGLLRLPEDVRRELRRRGAAGERLPSERDLRGALLAGRGSG